MKQIATILLLVMVSGSVYASRGQQATTTKTSNATRVAQEPVQNKTECARLQQVNSLTDSTAAVSTRTAKSGSNNNGVD